MRKKGQSPESQEFKTIEERIERLETRLETLEGRKADEARRELESLYEAFTS